jgi:hypothetical protein
MKMKYKEQDSLPTGIHTRIDDRTRISSAWRTFANINFESRAWETFLWVDDKIAEQYDTLRNADMVVDLHLDIMNDYLDSKRPKDIESTESPKPIEEV